MNHKLEQSLFDGEPVAGTDGSVGAIGTASSCGISAFAAGGNNRTNAVDSQPLSEVERMASVVRTERLWLNSHRYFKGKVSKPPLVEELYFMYLLFFLAVDRTLLV